MNRLRLPSSITVLAILCFFAPAATAQSPAVRDAMSALGRGDFRSAEQTLRVEVAAHPEDAWALSLLGAALDNLKRVSEAGAFHRRAVAKAPKSLDVLNNFAAHLWLAGREQEAGQVFREMVTIEPEHPGANLQLARLALKDGNPAEALRCLDRLAPADREHPRALLPRLEALYRTGDRQAGDALAGRLNTLAAQDPDLAFAAGLALSSGRQFERAEKFFEIALKSDPANFTLLFNTGAAAVSAGHFARGREVLEAALRQQPQNVDTLYALALADHGLRQWETAVQLLSQAAKIDPARADVQRMLAVATADLGALEDASAAWNRYLKLRPGDDAARRERGYTDAQRGHPEEGLKDLEWYAGRHPDDALGHYELGQALHGLDMFKALDEFTRALALDPNYVPARTARGSLFYQMGKPEDAMVDLEVAAKLRPGDAANLDRLGQTYQALDRSSDAVRVLKRASELAPADSKILLHFARALADAGSAEESKAAMDRFRRLGPEKKSGVRAGFVEYLSLSDSERRADYQSRLEKAIQTHPADPALRTERLKLLLTNGESKRAEAEARAILGMNPPAPVLADAGRALLASRRYLLAAELLQKAQSLGASETAATDLAIATRFSRAESLDGARDGRKVVDAVDQAVDSAPQRSDVYAAGAALLVAKQQVKDAIRLLDRAVHEFPSNRELLLLKAAAAELGGDGEGAEHELAAIRNRWPEWHQAWMVDGMILDRHGHFEEAYAALQTAVALGESGAEVHFYLADSLWHTGKAELAKREIAEASRLAPDDPWIKAFAADMAHDRKAQGEAPPYLTRWFVGGLAR